MSHETELAKLTLKLLLDSPAKLQEVLEELRSAMLEHLTAAKSGERPPESERRAQLLREFVARNGTPVLMAERPAEKGAGTLELELASRLPGLPEGAYIKISE